MSRSKSLPAPSCRGRWFRPSPLLDHLERRSRYRTHLPRVHRCSRWVREPEPDGPHEAEDPQTLKQVPDANETAWLHGLHENHSKPPCFFLWPYRCERDPLQYGTKPHAVPQVFSIMFELLEHKYLCRKKETVPACPCSTSTRLYRSPPETIKSPFQPPKETCWRVLVGHTDLRSCSWRSASVR